MMRVRTDGGVKRVAGAEFILYKEGGSEFYVPDPERYSQDGLPTRDAPVAFAPNAAVNRSVLVLFHRVRPVGKFGDVFCGVGSRAIRLHVEAGVEWSVLSDVNPIACQIAMINVRRLGLPSEVRCMDAVAALSTFDFDAVDLDVFGTPVPFAQAAFRCVRNGYVHVTATDLGSLYTPAARRKYLLEGPLPRRDTDLEVRAVVGALARLAASVDVGIKPVYCLVEPGVRIRVGVECRRGRSRANETLDTLDYVGGVGPIWGGDLHDKDVVEDMLEELDRIGWSEKHAQDVRRSLGGNVLST